MTPGNTRRRVLLIGKSQLVLDHAVAGLRDLGYEAEATNDFTDITGRFDAKKIDLVVFGGQVPPDRKTELREEIGAINSQVIFVQGLAGIPGLIVNQVQGAFRAEHQDPTRAPTYAPEERSIRLSLPDAVDVKVTVWWQTSFVPPDPRATRWSSSTTGSPVAITLSRSPITFRQRPRSPPCRSTRRSTPSVSPVSNEPPAEPELTAGRYALPHGAATHAC
jgi:hypothetical protein